MAEAYAWYEDQKVGLGEEFLRCIEANVNTIRRFPEMHEVKFKKFRRGLVRRFPYGVFYEYNSGENRVIIYGIFHNAENPKK